MSNTPKTPADAGPDLQRSVGLSGSEAKVLRLLVPLVQTLPFDDPAPGLPGVAMKSSGADTSRTAAEAVQLVVCGATRRS